MEFSLYRAIFGILLLLGCLGFFVLRQRNRLLEEINTLRKMLKAISHKQQKKNLKQTKQFHDGLKNDIIAAKNFLMLSETSKNTEQKTSFSNDAKRALTIAFDNANLLSNQIMPSPIKGGRIVEALQNYFANMQSSTGHIFEINLKTVVFEMSPVQSYEIYSIIIEFCENSIEHNSITEVNLTLVEEKEAFTFELKDNGSPFDIKKCYDNTQGNGLKTVFARLLNLNAKLIQKPELLGNKIIIKIPKI